MVLAAPEPPGSGPEPVAEETKRARPQLALAQSLSLPQRQRLDRAADPGAGGEGMALCQGHPRSPTGWQATGVLASCPQAGAWVQMPGLGALGLVRSFCARDSAKAGTAAWL